MPVIKPARKNTQNTKTAQIHKQQTNKEAIKRIK
jgi:hypothetical protein